MLLQSKPLALACIGQYLFIYWIFWNINQFLAKYWSDRCWGGALPHEHSVWSASRMFVSAGGMSSGHPIQQHCFVPRDALSTHWNLQMCSPVERAQAQLQWFRTFGQNGLRGTLYAWSKCVLRPVSFPRVRGYCWHAGQLFFRWSRYCGKPLWRGAFPTLPRDPPIPIHSLLFWETQPAPSVPSATVPVQIFILQYTDNRPSLLDCAHHLLLH